MYNSIHRNEHFVQAADVTHFDIYRTKMEDVDIYVDYVCDQI